MWGTTDNKVVVGEEGGNLQEKEFFITGGEIWLGSATGMIPRSSQKPEGTGVAQGVGEDGGKKKGLGIVGEDLRVEDGRIGTVPQSSVIQPRGSNGETTGDGTEGTGERKGFLMEKESLVILRLKERDSERKLETGGVRGAQGIEGDKSMSTETKGAEMIGAKGELQPGGRKVGNKGEEGRVGGFRTGL
jgi:hypothetical protein